VLLMILCAVIILSRSSYSVRYCEASADEAMRLQFIDKGNSVIFGGDAALPFFIGHELVSACTIMASALAWSDTVCGAEVGPVKVGGAING
jgi:hypothetical protein